MENSHEIETRSTRIEKLVWNAILAAIFFGLLMLDLELSNVMIEISSWDFADIATLSTLRILFVWILLLGFLVCFVAACWHATVAILWPLLVFLGVVGSEAAKAAAEASAETVKELDERGGLRGIVHRIWYGKQGPPK